MHFALPPRKTSHPPPYARNTSNTHIHRRRRQLQLGGYSVLALLTLYLVLRYILLADSDHARTGPSGIDGRQDIVIVTVLEDGLMSENYIHMVKKNREHYAAQHGKIT